MGDRRWIIYVLAVSLLVPLLLEGWTFFTMFRNVLVGSPPAERSPSADDRTPYYGEGDEVLPSTVPREVLRSMAIENRNERWVFSLVVDIKNTLDRPYRLELDEVVLQDGQVVKTQARRIVEPASEDTLEVNLDLPEGTIPRSLRVQVGGDTEGKNATTQVIPLSSVPVRKYSK